MNNVILGNSLSDWMLAAGLIFLGVLIGRLAAGLLKGHCRLVGRRWRAPVGPQELQA